MALLGTYLLLHAVACSIQDHYGILSTFFDGVPHPSELNQQVVDYEVMGPPLPPSWNTQTYRPGKTQIFEHVPYEMKLCNRCHLSDLGRRTDAANAALMGAAQLRFPKKKLCLSCHEKVERNFNHAPVNQGRCLLCHDPHKAAVEHNLIKPVKELCARCHQGDTFFMAKKHEEEPFASRDCNDCHDPHGADRPFLLKAGWKEGPIEPRVPSIVLKELVKDEFDRLEKEKADRQRAEAKRYNDEALKSRSRDAGDVRKE